MLVLLRSRSFALLRKTLHIRHERIPGVHALMVERSNQSGMNMIGKMLTTTLVVILVSGCASAGFKPLDLPVITLKQGATTNCTNTAVTSKPAFELCNAIEDTQGLLNRYAAYKNKLENSRVAFDSSLILLALGEFYNFLFQASERATNNVGLAALTSLSFRTYADPTEKSKLVRRTTAALTCVTNATETDPLLERLVVSQTLAPVVAAVQQRDSCVTTCQRACGNDQNCVNACDFSQSCDSIYSSTLHPRLSTASAVQTRYDLAQANLARSIRGKVTEIKNSYLALYESQLPDLDAILKKIVDAKGEDKALAERASQLTVQRNAFNLQSGTIYTDQLDEVEQRIVKLEQANAAVQQCSILD